MINIIYFATASPFKQANVFGLITVIKKTLFFDCILFFISGNRLCLL